MSRRLVLLAALVLASAPATSAQRVYFRHPTVFGGGDSATRILTGDTGSVELQVSTCSGVSAYSLRVFMDTSRVTVTGADSIPGFGLSKPTVTPGPNYFDVAASGAGFSGCTTRAATLRLQLAAGAAEGSLLSTQPLSLTSFTATDLLPTATTQLGQVCQAIRVWGDADGSRTVTSRDGLIVLTAALGLPTGGFDLGAADLDGDGTVTTRDALLTLSRAIGVGVSRAGEPQINRCAPLAPSPADAAFLSNGGLWRIAAGDTILQLMGFAPNSGYRPSWAPDGSRVLFTQFVSGFATDLLSAYVDGSGVDTLAVGTSSDYAPAWSPDGTRIAFVSSRVFPASLFVMDADAQNQVRLTDSINVYEAAWAPDGSEIVFSGYHQAACCTRRLWAVAPDGTGLREVFATSATYQPVNPAVSPAGDSIVFQMNGGDAYVVGRTGATDPAIAARLDFAHPYPQWVTDGIAFRGDVIFPYGFYLQRNDGRVLRLARGVSSSFTDLGMRQAGVFVASLTLSVDSTDIVGTTFQLTATVLNSDASPNVTVPVRWVSRDPTIATVDQTGLVTNLGPGGLTWIVATTGGWRSDSTRINALGFAPPARPGRQP